MKSHLTKLSNSGQEDNSKNLQFPGWFSRFCQALGITKTGEIATFCEVSPSLVSDWKAGRAYPRPEVLLKAANCGGTTIDWILTGENSKKSKDNPPPSQDFGDQMTVLLEYTMGQKVRELAASEGITPEDQVALFVWEALQERHLIRTKPESGEILQYLNAGERQIQWVKIRMRGYIAAGKPIMLLDDDHEEWIEAPDIMVKNSDVYALTAKGDSMIGEGVFDNDIVVIDPHGTIFNGTTVVAIIDGEGATLKKFYRNGTFATLVSANPSYAPIPIHLSRLQLKGVLVGTMRGRGKSF